MVISNDQEGEARVWWQFGVGFTREAAVVVAANAGDYAPFGFAGDVATGRLFQSEHALLGTIVTTYEPAVAEAVTTAALAAPRGAPARSFISRRR